MSVGVSLAAAFAVLLAGPTAPMPAPMPAPLPPVGPAPTSGPSPLLKMVTEGIPALEARAARGDGDAMYRLALAYEHGLTVESDPALAKNWYRKAAAAGDVSAMNNLGIGLTHSASAAERAEGVAWLLKAARSGKPAAEHAMYNLAGVYGTGYAVPLDPAEEHRWRLAAAKAGHGMAMLELGRAYDRGDGVPKDRAEALRWYRQAAEHADGWQRDVALEKVRELGVE